MIAILQKPCYNTFDFMEGAAVFMKLAYDNDTLVENKALILYVIDKIGKPVSNTTLLKIITGINDMNYFYFQQFLLDLLETKYIVSYQEEKETIYELTKEGKQALELIKDLIPGYLKFKVDNNFKEDLNKIENELSVTADFTPNSENDFTVKCQITENNKTIFEIETFANSTDQAKQIVDNWLKNAESIYPKILEILTNNK